MANARALIIDDNLNSILVLQQLLSLEHVDSEKLSTTTNLAANLERLHNIDLVFLDLEMPGMDGYSVLEIVKSHPNLRDARVIAYSVHVSELGNALDMGFDGFLGKPIGAEAFPEQLQRIMNGEKVWYLP